MTMSSRIRSVVMRQQETKWINRQFTMAPDSAAGTSSLFNGLEKGVTRDLRIANVCTFTQLRLAFRIEPSGASQLATSVRLIVLVDKQPNGSVITGTNVMSDTNLLNTFYADYNQNTVPARYRILWDKMFLLKQGVVAQFAPVSGTTQAVAQQPIYRKKIINLKRLKTRYNDGDDGDVTDIIDNALYVIAFSSQAAAAEPTIFMEYVLKYKDA